MEQGRDQWAHPNRQKGVEEMMSEPTRSYRTGLAICLLFALSNPAPSWAAATTVREPAWGLPHIYADTDLELARENGRQVAKDRLGQMILLGRVGRGTLSQAFGLLDPSTLDDDIETRRTQYTSSELNSMYAKLPQRIRDLVLEYCKGVNDVIDEVYAGTSPEPIEVDIIRNLLGLADDLFGNATNISDQVDPFYLAPGGADPQRPNGGFQFTPEMFVSIAVLQVRNFGFENFNESSRLNELQALIDSHGTTTGTEIWRDLNFLTDPLAPVSVPDPSTPGFGGPLAANAVPAETMVAQASSSPFAANLVASLASSSPAEQTTAENQCVGVAKADSKKLDVPSLVAVAKRWPAYGYATASREREERLAMRAERARSLGAWPALGSYSWIIAGSKSASGNPWLGGFPQTGIQTPSIMHFMENRSGEDIQTIGMEFAGAPAVLIGQTDTVAWTSTTAQLRVVDTFFEQVINEEIDGVRYNAEGTPAPLSQRTETFRGGILADTSVVMWRSHETNGNGGSRPIVDFLGDAEGTAESGTATTLEDSDASFGGALAGGYVLIIDGTGAGQIREIASVGATTLTVNTAWTTAPDDSSVYVAAESGEVIVAEAFDSLGYFEETTSAYGFASLQEATDVLDVRAAMRLVPSTHNFPSIDNQPYNGVGTNNGNGNIAYYSSGFSRKRQGGEEKLLPLDGTVSNPLVVVSGTVDSATDNTLTSTGAFTSLNLAPPALNFRYDNPTLQGSEYVVTITSGTGARQSRRIASNTNDDLTIESDWGVNPAPGDTFDVSEIVAMPEAINPAEGYSANWNNKASTADDGRGFGRNHRVAFILERLAAENAWDREKQRQLNKDLAGISGSGNRGRYLVPRLRQAFDDSCSGDATIEAVLLALEAHNDQTNCLSLGTSDACGRDFADPVFDTTRAGEEAFLSSLIDQLANDIYGDELAGAVSVPGGATGLALVLHAIDSAEGDVPGSYTQEYGSDYFNASSWESVVCGAMSAVAGGGIPADSPRGNSNYAHPLAALFPELVFEPTPSGNRGTWEQIVEAGSAVNGEFMFPLGQSGLIEGSFAGVDSIDPNVDSIQPIWRDWRFLPMLHVGQDLVGGGNPDSDGDGVWDSFERWYFGDLSRNAKDDSDGDKLKLVDEFLNGADPTDADTDDDGIPDGKDTAVQNRLESPPSKLKGFVKYGNDPNEDFLKIVAKFVTGPAEFDPDANDITLTVSDDDEIYTVTIPAGTMTEKKTDRKWLFKDKTGTLLNGLAKAIFVLGKDPGKPAKAIFKTAKTLDLSAADQNDHDVTTVVTIGGHEIPDTRLWEFNGTNKLKSTN